MSAMAEVRVNRGSTWSDLGPGELRLHHEAEGDRVALGHVRAHDEDGVGEPHVHLDGRGAAAAVRSAQTGHGRAVSYPGLVFEPDQPECPPAASAGRSSTRCPSSPRRARRWWRSG